jgi:hypothetical protein
MDIIFACQSCKQQLEAESSLSGTTIACPACGANITIPQPDPANLKSSPGADATPKEEKHFVVPVSDKPTESLIQKPRPPLDIAARTDGSKSLHVRCIRHTDCIEVGKDRFDEFVTEFLGKVGDTNVVSINTFNYTHIDLGSRALMTDYGVMIVYRA